MQLRRLTRGIIRDKEHAQLSLNKALSCIQATKVSIIMTAEVPLLALFGVLYLGEPISWRLVVGSVLIFGCGIGLNLLPAKSVLPSMR